MRKTSFVLGPLSVARSDRPQAKDGGAGTTDKGLLTKDVFCIIHPIRNRLLSVLATFGSETVDTANAVSLPSL